MADEQEGGAKPEAEVFTKTSPGETYVTPKDLGEFKDLVKKAYKKGWRLLVITALDQDPKIELIYHFDTGENFLYHIRYTVDPDVEHVSVVDMYPSAFLFENEICELMGMKVKGIEGKIFLGDDMAGMHPLRKSFKVEEILVKLQGPPEIHKVRQAQVEDKIGMTGRSEEDLKESDACEFDEEAVAAKAKKDAKAAPKAAKKAPEKKAAADEDEEEEKDGDA